MKKIFLIIALIFIAGIFALNEYLLYKQRPKDLAFVEEVTKPAVRFVRKFYKENNRLPDMDKHDFAEAGLKCLGTMGIYKGGDKFQDKNYKDFAKEIYIPENQYIIWIWRGEWAELYYSANSTIYSNIGKIYFPEETEEREITMEDFPTRFVWNGKNASPVLDTEMKQSYKTLITQASCLPPDFNGKYKIAQFGAGTMVHGFFIINLESGVVTEGFTFEIALDYSVDSELIIRNPKEAVLDCWKDELEAGEKIPEWCITEYYRFENEELKMIGQSKTEEEK